MPEESVKLKSEIQQAALEAVSAQPLEQETPQEQAERRIKKFQELMELVEKLYATRDGIVIEVLKDEMAEIFRQGAVEGSELQVEEKGDVRKIMVDKLGATIAKFIRNNPYLVHFISKGGGKGMGDPFTLSAEEWQERVKEIQAEIEGTGTTPGMREEEESIPPVIPGKKEEIPKDIPPPDRRPPVPPEDDRDGRKKGKNNGGTPPPPTPLRKKTRPIRPPKHIEPPIPIPPDIAETETFNPEYVRRLDGYIAIPGELVMFDVPENRVTANTGFEQLAADMPKAMQEGEFSLPETDPTITTWAMELLASTKYGHEQFPQKGAMGVRAKTGERGLNKVDARLDNAFGQIVEVLQNKAVEDSHTFAKQLASIVKELSLKMQEIIQTSDQGTFSAIKELQKGVSKISSEQFSQLSADQKLMWEKLNQEFVTDEKGNVMKTKKGNDIHFMDDIMGKLMRMRENITTKLSAKKPGEDIYDEQGLLKRVPRGNEQPISFPLKAGSREKKSILLGLLNTRKHEEYITDTTPEEEEDFIVASSPDRPIKPPENKPSEDEDDDFFEPVKK